MEEKEFYELEEMPVEKPKGVAWDKFKPEFDAKGFASAMKQAGLDSHKDIISNQHTALGILRQHWNLSLAALNEFAKGGK